MKVSVSSSPEHASRAVLADHLAARRETIHQTWHAAVAADPNLSQTAGTGPHGLRDQVPGVLASFEHRLRGSAPDPAPAPPPWSPGDDLRATILEWGHLQVCLLGELAAAPGADPVAVDAARAELARLVNAGIADAVEGSARLHAAAADTRQHELENTLAEFHHAGRRRVETWREASHDLRGQLNIVVSAIALLDDPTLPEPMREESFDVLKRAVRTLHKMLAELLDAGRHATGHESRRVAPFDAGALLGTLAASARPLARARGLTLRIEGPAALPVEGDRGKVERIAHQLVHNAIQHATTRPGEVTLAWAEDANERWHLAVRDTGPGLSAADAARLTHHNAPGEMNPSPPAADGHLGFPLVQRLAEALDAQAQVTTAPDQGTTIRISLPRRYA